MGIYLSLSKQEVLNRHHLSVFIPDWVEARIEGLLTGSNTRSIMVPRVGHRSGIETVCRSGRNRRAKWLLDYVSGDLKSATNRPFERVWPHPQPCVFMLSLNYFRTGKPYKTLETLKTLFVCAVRCDRSSEWQVANSRRSVSTKQFGTSWWLSGFIDTKLRQFLTTLKQGRLLLSSLSTRRGGHRSRLLWREVAMRL